MRRAALLLAVLAAGCATRGPALRSEGARAEVRAVEDEFLRELSRAGRRTPPSSAGPAPTTPP